MGSHQSTSDRPGINGRWVVIEGDNGTGKDTLAARLEANGFTVVNKLPDPQAAESHARTLSGRTKIEAFLEYNQICAKIAGTQSVPTLQMRYWPSTLAAAYADKIMSLQEVQALALEFNTSRMKPKLLLYLKCDFDERIKRIAQRGAIPNGDDITKNRSIRHEKAMLTFAQSMPEWINIDCTRITPKELFDAVFENIKSKGIK